MSNPVYATGQTVPIYVLFDRPLTVTNGQPALTLNSGGVAFWVGNDGNKLTFEYIVEAGDFAAILDWASNTALDAGGAKILDAWGKPADLWLPTPGGPRSLPATVIVGINSPPVHFPGGVSVGGKPSLAFNRSVHALGGVSVGGQPEVTVTHHYQLTTSGGVSVGGQPSIASEHVYASAGGVNVGGKPVLTFLHDFTTSGGVSVGGRPTIAYEHVHNSAGGVNVGGQAEVDPAHHPIVISVSGVSVNGTYYQGQSVFIGVQTNRHVVVTGTPRLLLETGATDRYALFDGMVAGDMMRFEYVVQAGDASADLDYVASNSLELNGGTINDNDTGVPAYLTLPAPGATSSLSDLADIVIDGVPPPSGLDILNVDSTTGDGTYGDTQSVTITVTFVDVVDVTGGPPHLALNCGADAVYDSGSGTAVLLFVLNITAGQNSANLDYTSNTALTLEGATIQFEDLTDADLTLPDPGDTGSLSVNSDIVIDTAAPTITSITSPQSGTFTETDVIEITVTFDEMVQVNSGVPELALNNGGVATFNSGNVTGTTGDVFTFFYTIGAGQETPLLNVNSISGDISDFSNPANALDTDMPAGNNLQDNTSIEIV